ncbi:tripartite tricarboxylate transporter TctB family protein [Allomesorhizobium alhagi]|jgi:putative tricarboxylic transport membrane protein|uniref:Putative tricarboxylic transport membrane protein n=1 Tax=Mesorhizobium alhagi CCNWXJ12-2 TaxID=1107882 RepID=H0HJW9_9HYPH|nr:tripartite tricarboxylate transporter TctB family protein [Mesorhizobium alhagi]EHK59032.1 putative tricarboxylic transport membrane protein [Mesorhizobium alhagi CCNWXJ12-2]
MSDGNQPRQERRPDRAALVIAAALAVVAIVIAWSTANMGGAATYARIGPTTFPYVIAFGLFVLAICTAYVALRGDFPQREEQNFPPMLWIVGGLAAQMLLLKTVGFSIATGLLFAATARGFGKGPLWMTVPLGIVLAFAIWFVFAKGLQLALPAGPLERLF